MTRPDLSDYLIHFTKDAGEVSATHTFCQIVTDGVLKGGTGMIKGGYSCVCFSEAPLEALKNGLINSNKTTQKYAPLGFMVRKDWLFRQGGRPVIYQAESEFFELPESMQWRHVTYEPPTIDFSWEREWRIQCNELAITPEDVTLIFPNKFAREVINSLVQDYKNSFSAYQKVARVNVKYTDPEHFDPEEYFSPNYWDEPPQIDDLVPEVFDWQAAYSPAKD